MKKGYFFSIDALIALLIVLSMIFIINPLPRETALENHVHDDLMEVLSTIKLSEINNSYIQSLIEDGTITNLNLSVLEQIGEFYALDKPEARIMTESILSEFSLKENLGLWFDEELIASSNSTSYDNAEGVLTSRQMITGIQKSESVKGYSARAFLSKISSSKYFYFGGYVGDGNITAEIEINGTIENLTLEIAVNRDFSLYINGIYSGTYLKSISSAYSPEKYRLPQEYLSNIHQGKNYIKIVGDGLYIAGGYIRLDYKTASIYQESKRYRFPGIEGIINLYDSFYIPGQLSNLSIYLSYYSNYSTFLNIGNQTIFKSNSTGQQNIVLEDPYLSEILDYSQIINKTIPLRLGLENVSYETAEGNADVILVTDLSGSMSLCLDGSSSWSCTDIEGVNPRRIELAKKLDKEFTNIILNATGNRVGLVTYNHDGYLTHDLTNDEASLISAIDNFVVGGATCIACSIRAARLMLEQQSDSSRKRYILVMSDGVANIEVNLSQPDSLQGCPVYWSWSRWTWCSQCLDCLYHSHNCGDYVSYTAINESIDESCKTRQLTNATLYSVGFAINTSCIEALDSLTEMASCGNGNYYASNNVVELENFYRSIASEILNLSYIEQIAEASDVNTILYPESFIDYSYVKEPLPYGLAITIETSEFNNTVTNGSFYVPANSNLVEARVISYSGPKWTDNVFVNDDNIYSLRVYGDNYVEFGDPYIIDIPESIIQQGDNNVNVTLASSPSNSTGGSVSDKVIYTLTKNFSSYSDIVPRSSGCIWQVQLEDNTNFTLSMPSNYSGIDNCYFTSQLISYENEDALDISTYNLLSMLDFNTNNKIDVRFDAENLKIESIELTGVPFTWSSEVQIRVWR